MGSTCCCPKDARTEAVNKDLRRDRDHDRLIKKLLFLGSGGSGKSTLFKQLRTIHGQGFKPQDRLTFVDHIHAQVIEQMKTAIECVENFGNDDEVEVENVNENETENENKNNKQAEHLGLLELSESGRLAAEIVTGLNVTKDPHASRQKLTPEMAEAIKTLWAEPQIREVYKQRAIMKIEDSTAHFWDKIDAIAATDYVPTEEDILLVRYRTTGVIEQQFKIKDNIFHIFDVGGQQSERKKWINCFDSVTAVIFVASLSCYDEIMFEEEDVNSMDDTLVLFESICNNHYFENTAMILFLNKEDLFRMKIETVPITICESFASFTGETTSFEETTDYIKTRFNSQNKNKDKNLFIHLTCATDQSNVQTVFNDVQHVIIENSLMSAGLMGEGDQDSAEVMEVPN